MADTIRYCCFAWLLVHRFVLKMHQNYWRPWKGVYNGGHTFYRLRNSTCLRLTIGATIQIVIRTIKSLINPYVAIGGGYFIPQTHFILLLWNRLELWQRLLWLFLNICGLKMLKNVSDISTSISNIKIVWDASRPSPSSLLPLLPSPFLSTSFPSPLPFRSRHPPIAAKRSGGAQAPPASPAGARLP